MTRPLWDDDYLRSFAKQLLTTGYENQFWTIDDDDCVAEFNDAHFRTMLRKFFPALGVWNLTLGSDRNGKTIRHLVFLRDGKSQEIDADSQTTQSFLTQLSNHISQICMARNLLRILPLVPFVSSKMVG